jgi:SHS2 domain-containing protein
MGCARWEHFQHVADMGVRGYGDTMAEAFEQAALALTAVVTDPGTVKTVETVQLECEAPDPELLLVDWLNALVYEMATRHMVFAEFEVSIDGDRLQGRAGGEPLRAARHHPAVEVKGATYTELAVKRDREGCWVGQCVVDV